MFVNELAFLTLALIAGACVCLASIFSWSSRYRVPMLDVRQTTSLGNSTPRVDAAV